MSTIVNPKGEVETPIHGNDQGSASPTYEARMFEHVLLKPKAAADRLGLSESTLAKLRMTRTGPSFCLLGRAVRYRAADLDAWVASRTVTTNTAA